MININNSILKVIFNIKDKISSVRGYTNLYDNASIEEIIEIIFGDGFGRKSEDELTDGDINNVVDRLVELYNDDEIYSKCDNINIFNYLRGKFNLDFITNEHNADDIFGFIEFGEGDVYIDPLTSIMYIKDSHKTYKYYNEMIENLIKKNLW